MQNYTTIKNLNNNSKPIFAALLLFLIVPPYFVWHTFIVPIAGVLFSILSLSEFNSKMISIGTVLIMLIYLYLSFVSDANLWGWINIISIIPMFFVSKRFSIDVYTCFYKIYLVTLVISFIVYIFVSILGIGLPNHSIQALNLVKYSRYFAYPFLVITDDGGFRFHGLFDEPGVIGTISGMILLIEHFDFKKKSNVMLFVITCFTFSMYFFVICALYVLCFVKLQYKLFVTGIIVLLTMLLWDNEVLYELVFKRFTLNNDGQLIGNTRDHGDFGAWFDSFRGTSGYYWGIGAGKGAEYNDGGCSYKQIIVDYGVVFFFLYCLSFLLSAKRYLIKYNSKILYFVLLSLTIYQRPFITHMVYVFFFFAGSILISHKEHGESTL